MLLTLQNAGDLFGVPAGNGRVQDLQNNRASLISENWQDCHFSKKGYLNDFAEVVASLDEKPGIAYADIDFKQCEERRQNMPLTKQRRADLYDLNDCRNKVGFRF